MLQVPLPNDRQNMKVVIQKVQNSIIERIHEGYYNSSNSPLEIPISGSGKVSFEIYIDGVLTETLDYDFK